MLRKCIDIDGTLLLNLGQVYEVRELNKNHYEMLETPNYGCAFGKYRFERIETDGKINRN